jgi:hypothetical protein
MRMVRYYQLVILHRFTQWRLHVLADSLQDGLLSQVIKIA